MASAAGELICQNRQSSILERAGAKGLSKSQTLVMAKAFIILIVIKIGLMVYWDSKHMNEGVLVLSYPFMADSVPLSKETQPRFPFLMNEELKCANRTPFLVLMIPSMPADTATRDVIRMTWGNESLLPGVVIARLFLLGVPSLYSVSVHNALSLESSTFKDIIQQDFLDTYNNLTLKTMMGMEWVARFCPNASYVMKIDSDMFLNPVFLVYQLLQPNLKVQNYFTGLIVKGNVPDRVKSSKWYLPWEAYWGVSYPSYCSGTGYVLSGDVAQKIFNIAYALNPLFIEDVFMGLCLAKLNIRITVPPNNVFVGERIEYNKCRFAKLITVHHYTKEELARLWPDFMEAKKSC
ncbi:beta-1,3-galactosyltransferase 2-like isoform X2 [Ambystoma mexicanum]